MLGMALVKEYPGKQDLNLFWVSVITVRLQ
jgi:hypothetical protein